MAKRNYKITKNYETVYYFLKDNGFSENYISNLRKVWGFIVLNSKIVNIKAKLSIGDILEIEATPNNKTIIENCDLPLDVVYEDEYYLLINKPSGISCMPNKSHYHLNIAGAICNYFKDENFVLRIINRLDKDTSGLILVAKDSIAQKDVKNIQKSYYAICEGKIDKEIVIDKKIQTISKDGVNERKRIISEDGKEAKTFVKPLKYNDKYSMIELKLEYGRTHQIRVHLSSIGHPLVGDELYGKKSEELSHTALVCNKMSFYHPYKEKNLSFEIPLPDDIKEFAKKYVD